MSYLEEYVDWLRGENQALYDELARQEREIKDLKKKIETYERQEKALEKAEQLSNECSVNKHLLYHIADLIDEWRGIPNV